MITGNTNMDIVIFQEMVESLSIKELRILNKNPALINRIKWISLQKNKEELVKIILDYGLETINCQNGDVWIGNKTELDKFSPSWADDSLPYNGYYFNFDKEFAPWARNFLLQDVRCNIWNKYLEKKLNDRSSKSQKNLTNNAEEYFGLYL